LKEGRRIVQAAVWKFELGGSMATRKDVESAEGKDAVV